MSPTEDIPTPSACIIDGMSLVHKLKGDGKTFAQLADSALYRALHEGTDSARTDVVFDIYRDESIKNAERCNRGSNTGTQWKNLHLVITYCSGRNSSEPQRTRCASLNS